MSSRVATSAYSTVLLIALASILALQATYDSLAVPAYAALVGVASLLVALLFAVRAVPHMPYMAYAFLPLAAISVCSLALSYDSSYAVFGTALELGTVSSYVLIALSAIAASLLRKSARYVMIGLIVAFVGAQLVLSGLSGMLSRHTEPRPGTSATAFVFMPEYAVSIRSALLGTGPRSFPKVWEKYHAAFLDGGLSAAPTPDRAYTTLSTIFVELGLMGAIAFFVPVLMLPVYLAWNRVFRIAPIAACTLACAPFILAIIYSVDLPILIAGALSFGVTVGFVRDAATPRIRVPHWIASGTWAVLGATFLYVGVLSGAAVEYENRGLRAESADDAAAYFIAAANLWDAPRYNLAASRILLDAARARFVGVESAIPADVRLNFNPPVSLLNAALEDNRPDYRAWLYAAELYTSLIRLDYPQALENARYAIERADELSAQRADVPYVRALLARAVGNEEAMLRYVREALQVDPYHAGARALAAELGTAP